ncbi:MAG: hypothetical protein NTY23_14535 [Chloroflexi bacterium]|nr:hypothetical protein [Chloroflexota bacterium]
MSEREPVADFSISPLCDVRATSWWKPRRVTVLGEPRAEDRLLRTFLDELIAAFREQEHEIVDSQAREVIADGRLDSTCLQVVPGHDQEIDV